MTYTKPRLTGYRAVSFIQGQCKNCGPAEPPSMNHSIAAYEADE
jgi:hypothetical protein